MKILIVEDTAKLAASLRSFLEMENNDVEVAEELSEARHFVSVTHFDMILLDIMLPDGDSRDFLRSLRAGNVNTPVIVMTARSEISDRVERPIYYNNHAPSARFCAARRPTQPALPPNTHAQGRCPRRLAHMSCVVLPTRSRRALERRAPAGWTRARGDAFAATSFLNLREARAKEARALSE